MTGKTPEQTAPADVFYNEDQSIKYHQNSRIIKIQKELTERALELLDLEEDKQYLFLDVGSGSGISSEVLENHGHFVLGVDLSLHMLKINYNEKFSKNENSNLMLDLVNMDIGEEWPFKEECFDYAISMSVIQWLFQSYQKSHIPTVRIKRFFKLLYNTIKYGAVLQFYCSKKEIEVLMQYSKAAGFEGGLQIDNEGTKNQKYFLVLSKHSNKKYNIDKKQKKRSEFNIEKNKYKGKRKFMRNKKRNKN